MATIRGFTLLQDLDRGPRSLVRRARRDADGLAVILKQLTTPAPTPRDLARYRFACDLNQRLDAPEICACLDLVVHEDRPVLVIEDIGGESLRSRLDGGPVPWRDAVAIAAQIADGLAALHGVDVVHRDVNPSNIVVAPDGRAQLIDFDLATPLLRGDVAATSPGRLEGTLTHLAPEQTGRMNRSVDARSDLYSLGLTLFELIEGRRPYPPSTDPLTLVHQHLAVPAARVTSAPAAVVDLVDRCLAKAPEDRYQTAAGLASDLRRSLEAPDGFALGEQDHDGRLRLREALYGREGEVATLLAAFDGVRDRGEPALLLIGGFSGVGKTALVRELHRPVTDSRGGFAAGKSDLLAVTPHRALAQALDALVSDALALPEDERQQIAERAKDAVGALGSLILDLVPRALHLIGRFEAAPTLPPAEARGRLEAVVARFLRSFAVDRPLVLFLDDLQWAGAPSLDLLRALVSDPGNGPILFVGAYRDNEVEEGHALLRVAGELQGGGAAIERLTLAPLDLAATTALVTDSLGPDAAALVPPLHRRTGGNPFFLREVLQGLNRDGALRFEGGGWTWDSDAVNAGGVSTNIAEVVVGRLRTLPDALQTVLAGGALLGGTFTLRRLGLALDRDLSSLGAQLRDAVTEGLLVPIGDAWRFDDLSALDEEIRYRFPHDRVQEAALALLPEEAARALRLRAGRNLQAAVGDEARFDVVGLLNPLSDSLEPDERRRLAALNLRAGERALASGAHSLARGCLEAGIAQAEGAWKDDPELLYGLHRQGAVAVEQCGDDGAAQALVDAALAHLDGEPAVRMLLIRQAWQGRTGAHAEGMATALSILERLGHSIPAEPEGWAALGEQLAARVAAALDGRPPSALADLPERTDADVGLAIEVLSGASPLIWAVPHTVPVINAWLVALFAEHGLDDRSAAAFASFALQNAAFGQYADAEAWGALAVAVAERRDQAAAWPAVGMMVGIWVRHWVGTVEDSLSLARRAVGAALDTGRAYDWGSWAAMNVPTLLLAQGAELDEAQRESEQLARIAARRLNVGDCERIILGGVHSMSRLLGDRERPAELELAGRSFSELIDSLAHYPMMQAVMQAGRMQAAAVLGEWAEVLEAAEACRATVDFGAGIIHRVQHRFYEALAKLVGGEDDIASMLELLEGWATHNPRLHGARVLLLRAEQLRLADDPTATEAYEQAIEAAHGPHLRGLCLERAARFHLDGALPRYGRALLEDAWVAYARWGAEAKLDRLATEFEFLGAQSIVRTMTTRTVSSTRSLDGLDSGTLTKATQAISSDLELGRLVETTLELMVENAGATGGALLLSGRDGLQELARRGEVDVAWTPVRFVERSGEALVIGDALASDRFGDDPAVRGGGVRSLMVLPIVRRGELQALVYLENRLVSEAFTDERCAMLDVLGAQASISFANARLFEEQQRQSRAIARFVPREFLGLLGRDDIADIQLGDAARLEMTVLFSDIRGFTSMSEQLEPEGMFALLNRYLGRVAPVIRRNGGFIDKFIGDAVMALFPGVSGGAVRAAVEMQEAVRALNDERVEGAPALRVGVGVHCGELILGTVGEPERLEASVIADAVNTASRLEGLTKRLGVDVIVSQQVYDRLEDADRLDSRALGRFDLRGRRSDLALREVVAALPEPQRSQRMKASARFEEGLRLLDERRWHEAMERFAGVLSGDPLDTPAGYHLDRARKAMFD